MKKMKKLQLKFETVKRLSDAQLGEVAGGLPKSNLTCQVGCGSIGCPTGQVSCPSACPLK
jgi:hypothetical protein